MVLMILDWFLTISFKAFAKELKLHLSFCSVLKDDSHNRFSLPTFQENNSNSNHEDTQISFDFDQPKLEALIHLGVDLDVNLNFQ